MGEIIGGIIFMAAFIAFAIWKGQKNPKDGDSLKSIHEQQYWESKNSQETNVVGDSDDNRDD